MLTIRQPALGIRDKYINKIIGKKLNLNLKANEPILENYIKNL
jgi:sialic acid synthase SpsE